MIHLQDVSLSYPDGDRRRTAVDRVDLTVPAGTVTGVTGPSGAGKSSLLAVAATLIRPDSGTVHLAGVDVGPLDARARAALRRESIGIVFQQPHLLGALTGREQLQVMGELGGDRRHRSRVRGRVEQLLAEVGMTEHAHRRPDRLSGGQRQRLAIARALVHDPSVLLVDEPTSALDQERGEEVMRLLAELTRSRGTATMVVTHDLQHRQHLDELVTVVDGRLVEPAAAR